MSVPHLPSDPTTLERKLGVVSLVDHEKGDLTLVHRDGTCSHLSADGSLLRDLRVGGLVQVLLKGPIVCTLPRL